MASKTIHVQSIANSRKGLGTAFETMVLAPGLPEKTHIETDETLARDEVVVRQNGGEIQAGLTAQLQRLKELLQ